MSSNQPVYIDRFLALAGRPDYRFLLLFENLEFENGRTDRLAIVEDILTWNEDQLRYVFKENKDYDITTVAFSELIDLPKGTIYENCAIFESVFNRALRKDYGIVSEDVIDRLITLTDTKKTGLRVGFIAEKLFDSRLSDNNKIRLAMVLSDIDGNGEHFKWGQYDLLHYDFLIPGYMYYYHNDAERAFQALTYVKAGTLKEMTDYYYHPVEKTLYRLIVKEGKVEVFKNIRSKIKATFIEDIISDYIARNKEVKEELGKHVTTPEAYAKLLQSFTFNMS